MIQDTTMSSSDDKDGPSSKNSRPPPYAATALALTVQDWSHLGVETIEEDAETGCTSDLEIIVDRVTALLLIRIVAVVVQKERCKNGNRMCFFADYSTSTICRTALVRQRPWHEYAPGVTENVIAQLRQFVSKMMSGYNNVPYHSREHGFHVVLSTNKLMDLMLSQPKGSTKTFGLRNDNIQLLALIFSAVIHDVEHRGIPNRQLVLERDELAILYNDQSIAENRSIFIAFKELLRKDDYDDLRDVMFNGSLDSEEYRRFRMTTVNLVLNTDIASPERTQLGKSKWKEAFGDPFETVERKLLKQARCSGNNGNNNRKAPPQPLLSISFNSLSDSPSETPESSEAEIDSDEDDDDNDDDNDGVIFSSKMGSNGVHTTSTSVANQSPIFREEGHQPAKEISNKGSRLSGRVHSGPERLHAHNEDDNAEHLQSQEAADDYYGYNDNSVDQADNFPTQEVSLTESQRESTTKIGNKATSSTPKLYGNKSPAEDHSDSDSDNDGVIISRSTKNTLVSKSPVSVHKTSTSHQSAEGRKKTIDYGSKITNSGEKQDLSPSSIEENVNIIEMNDSIELVDTHEHDESPVTREEDSNHLSANAEESETKEDINDQSQRIGFVVSGITLSSSQEEDFLLPDKTSDENIENNTNTEIGNKSSTQKAASPKKNTRRSKTRCSFSTPESVQSPALKQIESHIPNSTRQSFRRSGRFSLRDDFEEITNSSKFKRRMSTTITTPGSNNFRKRLGIRRSMDLSGEALEAYHKSTNHDTADDEPDELKAAVVLETIMTAADVAHNLQGWDQMVKWSGRLYLELKKAFNEGKGADPKFRWYENQIGFLESYLLPLAHRLEDTGVFGYRGEVFANAVESNRDRWLLEGMNVAQKIIDRGEEVFPIEGRSKPEGPTEIELKGTPACEEMQEEKKATERSSAPAVTELKLTPEVEELEGENIATETACARAVTEISPLIRFFFILLPLVSLLGCFHYYNTSPIRAGHPLKPGRWISKCGLYSLFPSICENSFVHVGYNGVVRFLDFQGNELWRIEGAICEEDEDSDHHERTDCVAGLYISNNGQLTVGGKHIPKLTMNTQLRESDLTPWPFVDIPKIKILKKKF